MPGIDGKISCGFTPGDDGDAFFRIGGQVKQKHLGLIQELANLTTLIVREESIYRGKALYIRVDGCGEMRNDVPPGFFAINKKDPLILPPLVQAAVNANLFTPIEKTDECRRAGIPIKRGVILAGLPGTGKTLTSQELAGLCVKHGWTYILVPKCQSLVRVMQFAERYSPAVVFCEDIDQVTDGERDESLNELLNTLDGVNTKNRDIVTVFTTNNVDKIERTIVRPGRIDAIIEFPAPDAATIEKFLRHYSCGMISPTESLSKSCQALDGCIPAIVREAVERSKLYAISRGASPENITITDEDIHTAVETMRAHVEIFQSKRDIVVSPEEKLGQAMSEILEPKFALIEEKLNEVASSL